MNETGEQNAEDAFVDDATIVRAAAPGHEISKDEDLTVVRPAPARTDAPETPGTTDEALHARAPNQLGPDHRGDPVLDPEKSEGIDAAAQRATSRAAGSQGAASGGLAAPRMLRRVASFMPRVYGPRAVATPQPTETATESAGGVAATNPRSALPSTARRDQQARVLTLVGYAAAVVIAGVGLWFVATLAFAG